MKKFILMLSAALIAGSTFAQKSKTEVPDAVKKSFESLFPGVKAEKWEKEGVTYEAEFHQGKTEMSVVFDGSGKHLQTETEIAVSELPKAVSDYAAKNFPGKKIKEAAKITEASGTVTYEAEIDGKDYIFDSSGNFVRIDDEQDHDDD